jgi:hypothetical protein
MLHLTGTATGGTGHGGAPLLRPGSPAAFTLFPPGNRDLPGSSEAYILKLARELHLQIRPPAGGVGIARTPSAEEGLENISEDIPEGAPSGTAEATEGIPLILSHETELIVLGLLLGIAQNFVGLAYLLEAPLGVLISRIGIGVVLANELAVGPLDLLRTGASGELKDFVIITL